MKRSCFLFFLFIFAYILIPQNENVSVENFEFINEFSYINALYQGKQGFIWICSKKELIRYDGYIFKKYTLEPAFDQISNSRITDIVEDKHGKLFITTSGNGLYRFDIDTEKFINYRLVKGDGPGIPSNNLYSIYIDKKDIIWIGSNDVGLIKYNQETNVFNKYSNNIQDKKSFPSNTVLDICQGSGDNLWVGTINGFCLFDVNKEESIFYKLKSESSKGGQLENVVSCLYLDKDRLWIGTRVNGLKSFDLKSKKISHYSTYYQKKSRYTHNYISLIQKDSSGQLWIGTYGGGFYKINAVSGKLSKLKINLNNNQFSSITRIRCFLEDHTGNIWVGASPGSLFKKDIRKEKFRKYSFLSENKNRIMAPVEAIYENADNYLWIGTNGKGLFKFDRTTGATINYKVLSSGPGSISSNYINTVYQDNHDKLYIGTFQNGLDIFDLKNNSFKNYKHDPEDPLSLSSDYILSFLKDSKGRIWIGTNKGGANLFDPESETFSKPMNRQKDNNIFSTVSYIYEDSKNNLYFGLNNGICFYDEKNKLFRQVNPSKGTVNGFVTVISEDENENLWIGTFEQGLYKYNIPSQTLSNYSTENKLTDNNILGLLKDEDANLWIGTYNGLSLFNSKKNKFSHFDMSDGLPTNQFRHGFFICKDGELIMGNINSVLGFFPQEIIKDTFLPKIKITDIQQLSEKNSDFGYKPEKKILICSYKDTFLISFSTLSFINTNKIKYSYILRGLNNDWIPIKNKNDLILSNLRPGKYSFQIKASYSDSLWTKEPAELDIIVIPPFWQTIWFKLLFSSLLMISLFIWYKIRIKKVTSRIKTEMQFDSYCSDRKLTNREKEVLVLALKGKTNKEIEDALYLSMGTIKVYVHNIYRKLEVKNRIELIKSFENMKNNEEF